MRQMCLWIGLRLVPGRRLVFTPEQPLESGLVCRHMKRGFGCDMQVCVRSRTGERAWRDGTEALCQVTQAEALHATAARIRLTVVRA